VPGPTPAARATSSSDAFARHGVTASRAESITELRASMHSDERGEKGMARAVLGAVRAPH